MRSPKAAQKRKNDVGDSSDDEDAKLAEIKRRKKSRKLCKTNTPPNESAAASTTEPATVPATVVATVPTSAPLQANKTTTTAKPTQPPPSTTDTTEALPELEHTEDTLANDEQSKRQKSPLGDDESIIVLSSDHDTTSADESTEETTKTAEKCKIKTEPFSMEDVNDAANSSTIDHTTPQALVQDGDSALRTQKEQQSEESDADDEESVQGHDSEMDVTDDEGKHQHQQPRQHVLHERPITDKANNSDDKTRTSHDGDQIRTNDTSGSSTSDDESDEESNDESEAEPETPPTTDASSELQKDTKSFVSALKQIHELVEDLVSCFSW